MRDLIFLCALYLDVFLEDMLKRVWRKGRLLLAWETGSVERLSEMQNELWPHLLCFLF